MQKQKKTKIMFVWFGAVTFVMLQALSELFKEKNEKAEFIIMSRSNDFERNFKGMKIKYTLILQKDFMRFFADTKNHMDVDFVINSSTPIFNNIILQRCLQNKANYMDLASIVEAKEFTDDIFDQNAFSKWYKDAWLMGIINAWISPWMTELLIAYAVKKHNFEPKSIRMHLDENFNSFIPLFSRAPKVALDEALSHAYCIKNKKICEIWPFHYEVKCMDRKCFNYYRISQEEIISLRQMYPKINTIEVFAWGSELEQIKFLYNSWLLSQEKIWSTWVSLLDIVKSKLPKAAQKHEMIDAWRRWLIDDAWFKATIDILDKNNMKIKITITFDFDSFKKIQNTAYRWATSISYPTGLWAASILMLTRQYGQSWIQNALSLGKNSPNDAIRQIISFLEKHFISITIQLEE
ncbi:MAG: hypothetical protein ACD_80C00145G0062 [uncultured bacterium (gcode 4)]|uniref:Uncharacterized protein n=1 Tax=uncultured bacterium (gcode 4) TaxID=1234023 RepID=K1XWZ8_9BACT|nr:MAG: hypothetical protein ACD_80C00145G0062 [uncultured bacterium (gcode 4)]